MKKERHLVPPSVIDEEEKKAHGGH